jgi:hypothetical protein
MTPERDAFAVTLEVPLGATIDYAFVITANRAGVPMEVWDANVAPNRDYHTAASANGVAEVAAPPSVRQSVPAGGGARDLLLWLTIAAFVGLGAWAAAARIDLGAASAATAARDAMLIVALGLATRLFLCALGYVSLAAVGTVEGGGERPSSVLALEEQAFGWADAHWYLDIARNGYEPREYSDSRHANWAFFPLFPLVLRAFTPFTDRLIAIAIVLNTALFAAALVVLHRLVLLDFDRNVALWTAILMLAFPAAYFCSRPGPEALFLLLSLSAFASARRERWITASAFGALATLTRLQGILLLLPFAYMMWRQAFRGRGPGIRGAALGLMPAALAGFMLHLWNVSGNPFASFAIQSVWDNAAALPFSGVLAFVAHPTVVGYYGFDLAPVSVAFGIAAFVLTVAAVYGPMPREYVIYAALSLVPILARNNTSATLRYLLPVFPLYLASALAVRERTALRNGVVGVFFGLQTFYFLAFVHRMGWAAN